MVENCLVGSVYNGEAFAVVGNRNGKTLGNRDTPSAACDVCTECVEIGNLAEVDVYNNTACIAKACVLALGAAVVAALSAVGKNTACVAIGSVRSGACGVFLACREDVLVNEVVEKGREFNDHFVELFRSHFRDVCVLRFFIEFADRVDILGGVFCDGCVFCDIEKELERFSGTCANGDGHGLGVGNVLGAGGGSGLVTEDNLCGTFLKCDELAVDNCYAVFTGDYAEYGVLDVDNRLVVAVCFGNDASANVGLTYNEAEVFCFKLLGHIERPLNVVGGNTVAAREEADVVAGVGVGPGPNGHTSVGSRLSEIVACRANDLASGVDGRVSALRREEVGVKRLKCSFPSGAVVLTRKEVAGRHTGAVGLGLCKEVGAERDNVYKIIHIVGIEKLEGGGNVACVATLEFYEDLAVLILEVIANLFKCGNLFVGDVAALVKDVILLDLGKGHLVNRKAAGVVGGTVESTIVHDNNLLVLGDFNVNLKDVRAVFISLDKAREGVFGSLSGVTAVTDHNGGSGHSVFNEVFVDSGGNSACVVGDDTVNACGDSGDSLELEFGSAAGDSRPNCNRVFLNLGNQFLGSVGRGNYTEGSGSRSYRNAEIVIGCIGRGVVDDKTGANDLLLGAEIRKDRSIGRNCGYVLASRVVHSRRELVVICGAVDVKDGEYIVSHTLSEEIGKVGNFAYVLVYAVGSIIGFEDSLVADALYVSDGVKKVKLVVIDVDEVGLDSFLNGSVGLNGYLEGFESNGTVVHGKTEKTLGVGCRGGIGLAGAYSGFVDIKNLRVVDRIFDILAVCLNL